MSIVTVDYLWDCECKTNYIHHKRELVCKICNVQQGDMPDSRLTEAIELAPHLLTRHSKEWWYKNYVQDK